MSEQYFLYHLHHEQDKGDYSKGYIGVTVCCKARLQGHRGSKDNPKIVQARSEGELFMDKVAKGTKKQMLKLEAKLRPKPDMGWNRAPGGGSSANGRANGLSRLGKPRKPHSEETKAKIAASMKGKNQGERSPETRAKISSGNKGKTRSLESRENMRKSKESAVRYVYQINEQEFRSAIEAGKFLGLSSTTVLRRCGSTTPQWADWTRTKL